MRPDRNLTIDLVKLAAAFGVIIIHLAPSTPGGEKLTGLFLIFAVPFFLITSLHFFIAKVQKLPAPRLHDLRLDRILVPYAVWTIVYTFMRWVKFRAGGLPFGIDVIGTTFFGGGAVHLYFLPLLLLFQALALALILFFRDWQWRWVGLVVALGAVLYGHFGSAGDYFGFQHALESGAMYVAGAFLLGWMQTSARGRQFNAALGWLTLAFIVSRNLFGFPPVALGLMQGPLVGYGVAAFAFNWHFQSARPALGTLLTCSYGVYLAHFGFLETYEFAAQKLGHTLTPYSVATKLLLASLIALTSVLFILLARGHWLPAYLFLGESTPPPPDKATPRASPPSTAAADGAERG